MGTPAAVIAAKIIGWLQVAWLLAIGFSALVLSDGWGPFGHKIAVVGFMLSLVAASYFAIPLMFLRAGQPNGRVVVIILEGLAGLVLFVLAAQDSFHDGSYVLPIPCFAVVGLLLTRPAAKWSAPPSVAPTPVGGWRPPSSEAWAPPQWTPPPTGTAVPNATASPAGPAIPPRYRYGTRKAEDDSPTA